MTETAMESRWIGHPRGLFILFMTEMWERFSYYGMRALLILYLTKHWLYEDGKAGLIYGSYAALVYAMPVLGGMIADRYLGLKKAIVFGACLLVLGHFGMAFEGPAAYINDGMLIREGIYEKIFYLSLAFIVVGVGFLKANISTIVGSLYGEDDPRRDGGFTIFYMGINLGAFSATIICAYLGENFGWRYGFGLAGVGMLLGLLTFLRGQKYLSGLGLPPNPQVLSSKWMGISTESLIYVSSLFLVAGIWVALQYTGELGLALLIFSGVVFSYIVWFSLSSCTPRERDRMLVMLFLMIMSVLFWALFEQAGSSLTLFTDRNIDKGIFTAGMFQSLNPAFIIILAPLFAYIWVKLSQRDIEPSTPVKFALAIFQVGLGFAVLVFGISQAGEDGQVAVIWLVLMYLLHTTGELCLSPVGLSMVTKLSVQKVAAMMMGVWFLSSALAAYAGGMIAGLMAIEDSPASSVSPLASLAVYSNVFESLAWLAVLMGVGLFLVSPWLARKMH
jgi:POT family proton-dependent oligopeptide transporter